MNWNFDHLRLIYALTFAMAAIAVYGPFVIILGHSHALPWIASLGFMVGWLKGPFM